MDQKNQLANETPINKKKMPTFKCCCGTEILIVPDISAMGTAIKEHVDEHRKITGKRITQELLAQQVLKALSEHFC